MRLATPRWWYVRDRGTAVVLRALLTPLSWIWAAATARRLARTTPGEAGLPVICVGNLTVGGTGKTPVVRALLQRLSERGVSAAGLSRGHGGRQEGPLQVDPAVHTAGDVGDEPLMLAQDLTIWIARDRLAGARAARAAGAQVVVMDDGHQNPSVKKALSLVVVDGESRDDEWPFGDGTVFPAGPLREPLPVGLARADAVLIILPADLAAPDPELLALFSGKPVLIVRIEPLAAPPPGPLVGFAGVGKPWKIERALIAAGGEVVDFIPLPDHTAPGPQTIGWLRRRAQALGARLITTEKDWVRLPTELRAQVTAWPIQARFEDPAALDRLLAGVLEARV